MTDNRPEDDLEQYRKDIDAAERKVNSEIDPGLRGVVVAVGVLLLLLSFALPHTGGANGWDVLVGNDAAVAESIALPSRVFVWLALVFGVVFGALALVTRRWALAWLSLAGCAVADVFGMLAIWSRQTLSPSDPGGGPGIGLILGWIVVLVLTFHWIRVVWSRTAVQLAAEQERREKTAEAEQRDIWGDLNK
ncbi:hypothetical protein [Rhodococcus sp. NPDC059234]|uniref:Rv2732c family membrane protein n=1 Tax=Rhodococcus sp. NPDC059234 TaxID=3346781 RepID=UPI00366A60C4